mmetsp:Transcript_161152/g.517282  ORF Transcript_161152/g.517282 Transcript_161152/m.517282 type:complete len:344 (-) Transcript_161152:1164-2195(-)
MQVADYIQHLGEGPLQDGVRANDANHPTTILHVVLHEYLAPAVLANLCDPRPTLADEFLTVCNKQHQAEHILALLLTDKIRLRRVNFVLLLDVSKNLDYVQQLACRKADLVLIFSPQDKYPISLSLVASKLTGQMKLATPILRSRPLRQGGGQSVRTDNLQGAPCAQRRSRTTAHRAVMQHRLCHGSFCSVKRCRCDGGRRFRTPRHGSRRHCSHRHCTPSCRRRLCRRAARRDRRPHPWRGRPPRLCPDTLCSGNLCGCSRRFRRDRRLQHLWLCHLGKHDLRSHHLRSHDDFDLPWLRLHKSWLPKPCGHRPAGLHLREQRLHRLHRLHLLQLRCRRLLKP